MTDYYEELGLDRSLGLAELNRELSRQESVWKGRRTRVPEKAVKMLALIVDARKAFATDASRAAYDRALAESGRPKPQAKAASKTISGSAKWAQQAREYCDSGQFDLAKVALEKALAAPQLLGVTRLDDDPEFCLLASRVYLGLGGSYYQQALDWANKAIVQEPASAAYEVQKTCALVGLGQNQKARDSAERAIAKAARAGDRAEEGQACGLLAAIRYVSFNERGDEVEQLAKRAVQLGDAMGNGKQVIDDIEKKRQEARRQAEAQAKREAEQKASEERARKAAEESQRKKEATDALKRRLGVHHTVGWVAFFACWAAVVCPSLGLSGMDGTTAFFAAYNVGLNAFLLGLGIAWLHVSHSAWNASAGYGYIGAPWIWTVIAALAGGFVIATGYYTQLGFSRASADATWKFLGILLLCYLILSGVSRYVGKRLYESRKEAIDSGANA